MKEEIYYNVRLLAWVVAYFKDGYVYAPPAFTFEDKPTEEVLEACRVEAQDAFERKVNGSVQAP